MFPVVHHTFGLGAVVFVSQFDLSACRDAEIQFPMVPDVLTSLLVRSVYMVQQLHAIVVWMILPLLLFSVARWQRVRSRVNVHTFAGIDR